MKKKTNLLLSFFLFLWIIFPIFVKAGNGSISLSGNSKVESGSTFTIDVYANVTSGSLGTMGGTLVSNNTSCVTLQSISKVASGSDAQGGIISFFDLNGSGSKTIVRATFKAADETCNASITLKDITMAFTDGQDYDLPSVSKSINVIKLSSNNNLSSLTVNNGSLSPGFSAGNTNYQVNVGSNVDAITIAASAEDNKSSVSGTGNKKLNYGANKFTIAVKAENGSVKNYVVTVNREDNRSSDNNLKSLTVNGGSLSPGFSANTTNYNLDVPYEIAKLNINAVAQDSKAKVSIDNPDLVAEKTTDVTIKVTAENGSSKTYTIHVSRGKDPNKVLNTDNNLTNLVPSIGILSPVFDSNKTNYFIYLPYEIEEIAFEYSVSDQTYGKAKLDGPEKLVANSANKYTITVTAEDESTKVYTITVYRAANPEALVGDNTKLKKLVLYNGKLNKKFDGNTFSYTYTKKKGFRYEYELEDENSSVKVIEQEDSIYFIVEAPNGNISVYCLHEKKTNIVVILCLVISSLAILGGAFYFLYYRKGYKKILEKLK